MLFNSLDFLIFLAVVTPLYFLLPRVQRSLLLAASLFFYGYWNPPYLLLIFLSAAVDFFAAQRIARSRGRVRGLWLGASVATNLGILATFKYAGFLTENLAVLTSALGLDWIPAQVSLLLPMGISFYTFQSLAYSIEVYRGRYQPLSRFRDLLLFVSFFPQLVAGPIVRPAYLVPQLRDGVRFDAEAFTGGMARVGKGLAKKLLVADVLGAYVNTVFANPSQFDAAQMLMAIYAFAIQIYCDFSGYTDIALGVARSLGYRLPENFAYPYHAGSITEFWRRWHMSLSTWLRDYLYISLGGNRRGGGRTYLNLMLTMLLGGLWHGAAWTFVLWGGLHGAVLILERVLGVRDRKSRTALEATLRGLLTFHLVCLGWIFFRAEDLGAAKAVIDTLIHGAWSLSTLEPYLVGLMAAFALAHEVDRRWSFEVISRTPLGLAGSLAAIAISVAVLLHGTPSEFIYFQF